MVSIHISRRKSETKIDCQDVTNILVTNSYLN